MLSKHRLLYLMAVLIALLVSLYLLLPRLVVMVASSELAAAGFHHASIELSSLGWSKARLDSIRVQADDGSLQLKLTGVELGYSLAGLMRGRCEQLDIKRLQLTLVNKAGSSSSDSTGGWSTSMLALIPADRVNVQAIAVQLPATSRVQQLSGRLEYHDQRLQTRLELTADQDKYLLDAAIESAGAVQLTLARQLSGTLLPLVSLQGKTGLEVGPTGARYRFAGSLNAGLASLAPLFLPELQRVDGTAQVNMTLSWPVSMPASPGLLLEQLSGDADVTVQVSDGQWGAFDRFFLRAALALHVDEGQLHWSLDKGFALEAHQPGVKTVAGESLLQLPAGLHGLIRNSNDQWLLTLPADQHLRLAAVQYAEQALPALSLTLSQPLQLAIEPDGAWQLQSAGFTLPAQHYTFSGLQLSYQGVSCALAAGASWQLKMHGMALSGKDTGIQADRLNVTIEPGEGLIRTRFSMTGKGGKTLLRGSSLFNPEGRSWMKWDIPTQHMAGHGGVADWLTLPPAFALDAGTIALHGNSHWQAGGARLRHALNIVITGAGGRLNEHYFSGLTMQLRLAGGQLLRSQPVELRLAELNAGVPVHDVQADFLLSLPLNGGKPTLNLDRFSLQFMGGQVSSAATTVDFNRRQHAVRLHVEHLDVGQLLALEKEQGLSGSGALNGVIPLDWSADGIRVQGATLSSQPPGGVIHYAPNHAAKNLASSNAKMQLLLGIFDDFHYDQMDVKADYAEDGRLLMQVKLTGNNPAYAAGRAVAFNLNLEENVLTLLKSLRADGEIGTRLEKRVQKHLKK